MLEQLAEVFALALVAEAIRASGWIEKVESRVATWPRNLHGGLGDLLDGGRLQGRGEQVIFGAHEQEEGRVDLAFWLVGYFCTPV